MSVDFLNGLPPQWGVFGAVAAACVYGITRALVDRKSPEAQRAVSQESTMGQTPPVPLWAMFGPVHESMQDISSMAEEGRKSNAILSDMCKAVRDLDTGQTHTHRLLEAILREQELRVPITTDPHRRRQN